MGTITFTVPAALDYANDDQLEAVVRLAEHAAVEVAPGSFDLPKGYLSFKQDYNSGGPPIYGGIAPDGAVST